MQIAILTQDNHFLINGSTMHLVSNLKMLGLDIVVFRTNATAKGRRTSKIGTLREMVNLFGVWFAVRSIGLFVASKIINRDSKLGQLCKIVDIPDDTKLTQGVFREHCLNFKALLILSGTRIIPADVLAMWEHGVVNVHSSVLPYSRGLMPALWTYIEKRGLGVTLFRVDEGIDTGEILAQIALLERPASYLEHLVQTKSIGVSLLTAWVINNLLNASSRIEIESTYNKYPSPDFRLRDHQ